MIRCPSCHKAHPENTLFCDECGAYLVDEGDKRTDPLMMETSAWVDREAAMAGVKSADAARPVTLSILIVDAERQIQFPLAKELSMGRLDAASATFPDVDLTSYGGLEKGISRRHAKITRQDNQISLEDLGSVNGTYLNGQRLTPYLQYPLTSGDEIQLGKLVLRIRFG
ncbi:MAG: FHA domain-containing protein [Chloroflexota bacterium]